MWCCRYGAIKYAFFDTTTVTKSTPSFYSALSDRQREAILREEIGTRKRTGIQHLSDESLKKLMLSFKGDENPEQGQRVGSHSFDCLLDREVAETVAYVPFYIAERTKYVGD